MRLTPGTVAILEYPIPETPPARPGVTPSVPASWLAPWEDAEIVLLLPRNGGKGHNLEALAGWHRARGGVTLLVSHSRWTGIAAVDRSLVAGTLTQGAWSLRRLYALAPPTAVSADMGRAPQTAFLDRDGTIIEDRDYLADPEGVSLLPGAAEGLRMLAADGTKLVVLTNQSGVGSGRITIEQLGRVNQRLREVLEAKGVTLDGIYCCVHRSDAGCDCRKPATGLARRAAADLGIMPDRSLVVGDKASDLGLARALGAPAFLVTTGYGPSTLTDRTVSADYVVDGLDQVARICCHPSGLAVPVEPPLA
jgi:D-glycero-D-manno-heptose 1,7-bisphosphate phosphatase